MKLTAAFHTTTIERGQCEIRPGKPVTREIKPRTPHIAKLMALAVRLDGLLYDGTVRDQADLARLADVSRARVTQVLNLNLLAPDIQEAILNLPPVEQGQVAITERNVRPIAAMPSWSKQRRMWEQVTR
jgi:hypothetical protein